MKPTAMSASPAPQCLSTIILCAALGISLAGCQETERYKLDKDENGRTIRLDQKTGEITVIEGDTLQVLRSQEEAAELQKAENSALSTPKSFAIIDAGYFGKNTKATMSTIWRDGRLHYKFRIYAAPAKILKARDSYAHQGGLFFTLSDRNDFELARIDVPTHELVGVHGVDNKVFAFDVAGTQGMSKDNYASIVTWNMGWRGYED